MTHFSSFLIPLKRLATRLMVLMGLCAGVMILSEKIKKIPYLAVSQHRKKQASLPNKQALQDGIMLKDYTVLCNDNDGINAQLDQLKVEYRERWKSLNTKELHTCLQKIADTLAPRYLPFITHRYKKHQFTNHGSPSEKGFYILKAGPEWMSFVDSSPQSLQFSIEYPSTCNREYSLDIAMVILAHEMAHRARMHPARIYIHEKYKLPPLTEISADDFLRDVLNISYDEYCDNLSQFQESEADYCAFIVLRSIEAVQQHILRRLTSYRQQSASHPSSDYRIHIGIEYWIQYVMQENNIDYETACGQVLEEYNQFIHDAQLPQDLKNVALSLFSGKDVQSNNNECNNDDESYIGSLVTLVKNPSLAEDEIIPVDYTVVYGDDDGINAQLDALKAEYHDRWKDLNKEALRECLQKIADTLAPRYLPFIAYRYKNYQFIQHDNPCSTSFYTLTPGTSWGLSIQAPDNKLLIFIDYPSSCNTNQSFERVLIVLAHEMTHRARAHSALFHIHRLNNQQPLTTVPAPDFLNHELHISFDQLCSNLSQHNESEADYCGMIALRSIDAVKEHILAHIYESDFHTPTRSHPGSRYRIRLGIEYWIQYVMKQNNVDYETACQTVGQEYRQFVSGLSLPQQMLTAALQLAPDQC